MLGLRDRRVRLALLGIAGGVSKHRRARDGHRRAARDRHRRGGGLRITTKDHSRHRHDGVGLKPHLALPLQG